MNIKSLLSQASIYTFSNILSRSISLLLVPLYTKVLSPSDYGIVDILTISCGLINLTIALEIHQAIARFYNEWSLADQKKNISTALIFTLVIYTLFSLFLIPFRINLSDFFLESKNKINIINETILVSWTSGVYYFTQSQLRWQLKAKNHAFVSVIFTIITTFTTSILILYFHLGISGVLYGLIIGNLTGIFLSIYFTRDFYINYFDFTRLIILLKFSTPLVLSSVSVFISLYIDRILIKNMLSLNELGLFSIGYKFASIVGLLTTGINLAITPLIYKHYKDPNTKSKLETIFIYYFYFASIIFVGITIFAETIILTFTTPDYINAKNVIPYLVLTSLLASIYNFTPGLFIANKTKIVTYINIAVAIINLCLNIYLIPIFGIIGAAIGSLTGYTIAFLIYIYFNQKYYPLNFQYSKIVAIIIFSLFTILISTVGKNILPNYAFSLNIIYLVLFVLGLYKYLFKRNHLKLT